MNLEALTLSIKRKARELGFEWVGVTIPDPTPNVSVYENWLNAGLHGEMSYLASLRARQRRADPKRILPECESIVMLGLRHPSPQSTRKPSQPGPFGRVASYAWGFDYHGVIPPRMDLLVAFLEDQVGHPIPNRRYTDTGPILERDLAQQAGLGWIGKNTCLIHPRMGSYFLLAEIFLGIALKPDPPFTSDHCGSCTRCLDACPTHCILPDRTIDAQRCISYLTIELKGSIPRAMRAQIGEWVFGCDICQDVCPWNVRFAGLNGDPDLNPRPGVPYPNLHQDLTLTPQSFNSKFKGSPIKRTKRSGYLRNVATVLGNAGYKSSIPPLTKSLLEDQEPLVREHAAWALSQIGGNEAVKALKLALSHENNPAVRQEFLTSLSELDHPSPGAQSHQD